MDPELNPNLPPPLGSKERLATDIKHVAADATGLAREIAASTAGNLAHAKEMAKGTVEDAAAYATREKAVLAGRVRSTAISTDEYVKTNPWKAVGAAAAAGLLIGLLIGRR